MIIQEFAQEGRPLPEGPADEVNALSTLAPEVTEISQDAPRIAVTV